jgi:hypothetical protein
MIDGIDGIGGIGGIDDAETLKHSGGTYGT